MPTSAEVAKYLNTTEERINQILSEATTVMSIYEKKGNGEDSVEIIDTIVDTNSRNPLENAEDENIKEQLEKALKILPEKERVIMVLYYQKNMTFKEIGETIGMSESRTCQVHAQALMRLKRILTRTRHFRLCRRIVA